MTDAEIVNEALENIWDQQLFDDAFWLEEIARRISSDSTDTAPVFDNNTTAGAAK